MNALKGRPPILYGAIALAALSLIWSGYAIADLMHSGKFGLSVAIAGDIGWVTVLWAEYKGVTIAGRRWTATAAGWAIAFGVAALLVIHGQQAGGLAQAIAGPFVVVVGKTVWAFAIEAMRAADYDPTAPTPEQEEEINALIRDSGYEVRKRRAEINRDTAVEIAEVQAWGDIRLQRLDVDFRVLSEQQAKQRELSAREPLGLSGPDIGADIRPDGTPDASGRADGHTSGRADSVSSVPAPTSADTRPDTVREIAAKASGPADLVRSLHGHGVRHDDLVRTAVELRPDMNADSIRRTAKRIGNPYA